MTSVLAQRLACLAEVQVFVVHVQRQSLTPSEVDALPERHPSVTEVGPQQQQVRVLRKMLVGLRGSDESGRGESAGGEGECNPAHTVNGGRKLAP